MTHPIFLKRLEYCIPDIAAAHFNLANVNIDFEKGNLSLEGDRQLMLGDSGKSKPARSAPYKERIKVKATIYPGVSVHLSDHELAFSLEGIMEDEKSINSCSGLLVLHNTAGGKGPGSGTWYLAVYLYDDYNEEREIKLNLTMFALVKNAELN